MTLSYATLPGDLDHMIENDFAIVEAQFTHLEAGRANRRVLVDQISFELALHAFAVEQVLYPVFEETGQTRDLEQARERNNAAKELLVTLDRTEPGDPDFEQALTELMAGVRAQHAGSDAESLPALREKVGAERLAALGKEYLAAKRAAPTAPHPHAPDKGVAEKIAGALSKPLDQAKAAMSGKKKELATDASGLMHPQAQAIVDAHSALGPLPFEILEPEQARRQPGPKEAVLEVMKARGIEGPEPVGSVEDLQVPDGAGGTQRLRVYTPEGVAPDAPVVFWIHGGGWVLFTIDDHYDDSCRGLCNKTGAIVGDAGLPARARGRLPRLARRRPRGVPLGAGRTPPPSAATRPASRSAASRSAGTWRRPPCCSSRRPASSCRVAQVLVYPVATAEQFGESMVDAADGRPLNRALLSWMAMHAFEGQPDAAKDPRIDLLGWSDEQLAAHAADAGHHRRARRPAQPGPGVRQGSSAPPGSRPRSPTSRARCTSSSAPRPSSSWPSRRSRTPPSTCSLPSAAAAPPPPTPTRPATRPVPARSRAARSSSRHAGPASDDAGRPRRAAPCRARGRLTPSGPRVAPTTDAASGRVVVVEAPGASTARRRQEQGVPDPYGTRPGLRQRVVARRRQEVPTTQLRALRRAGADVFDLALLVERRRGELQAAGTHPWDADPATASLLLAAWNARALHTLGSALLDSDEREDPATAGFVPPVTHRQVWALLEPVGGWIALARRAESNADFWIGSLADLPAGLPPLLSSRSGPRKHVRGLLAAGDALDVLVEQQLSAVLAAGPPPRRHAARLARVQELFAQARASLHYAQGLWHPELGRDLEAVLLDHLQPSLVLHHHLGQYLALPELVVAYRTGWGTP